MESFLYSFIWHIERVAGISKYLKADVPIRDQFNDEFHDYHFIIGAVFFEMNQGIEIPDEMLDYSLTFREFVEKLDKLPRISDAEFPQFVEAKEYMLRVLLGVEQYGMVN
ncbi:MAG: hypothetical protein ABSF91_11540 [Bacteroidota bacterium]|jgi:hypothetical protein